MILASKFQASSRRREKEKHRSFCSAHVVFFVRLDITNGLGGRIAHVPEEVFATRAAPDRIRIRTRILLRRPPLPKQTLESKAHVPAKISVRVPKDLFQSATQSGNHHLVQRSSVALEPLENKKTPKDIPRLGPVSTADALLRCGIKERIPVKRPQSAGARKTFTEEIHFDTETSDSFPPKCVPCSA